MIRRLAASGEILVLGDVNVDIIARVKSFPEPGEECLAPRLELHCGGVGANYAFALRQWSISPCLVACSLQQGCESTHIEKEKRQSFWDARHVGKKRGATIASSHKSTFRHRAFASAPCVNVYRSSPNGIAFTNAVTNRVGFPGHCRSYSGLPK
jgi:sugar/nucleoside kinase (ribokinase family)